MSRSTENDIDTTINISRSVQQGTSHTDDDDIACEGKVGDVLYQRLILGYFTAL